MGCSCMKRMSVRQQLKWSMISVRSILLRRETILEDLTILNCTSPFLIFKIVVTHHKGPKAGWRLHCETITKRGTLETDSHSFIKSKSGFLGGAKRLHCPANIRYYHMMKRASHLSFRFRWPTSCLWTSWMELHQWVRMYEVRLMERRPALSI